jgi:hypothetical protein
VPVTGPLGLDAVPNAWAALRWLVRPSGWTHSIGVSARFVGQNKAASFALVVVVLLLLGIGPVAASRMKSACAEFARAPSSWSAVEALFWAHVLAVRWPAAAGAVAWLLSAPSDAPPLAAALGAGLRGILNPLCLIQLLRWLCAPGASGRILGGAGRRIRAAGIG